MPATQESRKPSPIVTINRTLFLEGKRKNRRKRIQTLRHADGLSRCFILTWIALENFWWDMKRRLTIILLWFILLVLLSFGASSSLFIKNNFGISSKTQQITIDNFRQVLNNNLIKSAPQDEFAELVTLRKSPCLIYCVLLTTIQSVLLIA